MEAMIDHLIGAPKKTVIIMLGKPQNDFKDEIVYIAKSYFLIYIKGNFICSFIRDG
ncbi:hypothetical protein SAMN05421679_1045 [Epilithonimonas pallida]|uniref:Uncharacterized protein n=1 Tax=Epilithonimonas pallida TaxID=373671 RepID=A0ABY1R1I1_9FLAO|nr:hypothetical protein SAMN05421679_1045 [Epilithonimonas pallida]